MFSFNPMLSIVHLPRPPRMLAYIRSRFRALDIDIDTVSEILACYGLKLTFHPKNLPNARRNRNLIVNTTNGKKILKLYRRDWQISTIDFEHSILTQLATLNFPAPRLVTTLNGETHINLAGWNYSLFDFIEGTNYSSSFLLRVHRQILMRIAGKTMAHFHRHLEGFSPQGRHHLGFKNYTSGRHRDLTWHIEKVADLKKKSYQLIGTERESDTVRTSTINWLLQNSEYILAEIGRLDEILKNAQLPRLIIHGDFGLHNLIFQNMDQATPVDFELARLEWRLSDLVSCLSRFRYSNGMADSESMQWFMEAYQEVYPLSPSEWQFFPQVWQFYKTQGAVQYWNSYFETDGPTRKLLSARDAMAQANWAVNHPDRLLELKR